MFHKQTEVSTAARHQFLGPRLPQSPLALRCPHSSLDGLISCSTVCGAPAIPPGWSGSSFAQHQFAALGNGIELFAGQFCMREGKDDAKRDADSCRLDIDRTAAR
jgi:hypothetical protein